MVKASAINLGVNINPDGFKLTGGDSSPRGLTVAGANDFTLSSQASTGTLILPNAQASTLIGSDSFTAKGDLLTATSSGTPSILPVGTSGYVLTASSSASTGITWAASGGGGGNTTYFSAYHNVNQTPTVGIFQDILFNTVGTNPGGNYNASLSQYVTPSAGVYLFSVSLYFLFGATHTDLQVRLVIPSLDGPYLTVCNPNVFSANQEFAGVYTVVGYFGSSLSVSVQVKLSTGNAYTIYHSSGAYPVFSGFKIM